MSLDQGMATAAQKNAGTSNLVQKKDKTLLLRFPPMYVVVGAYRFVNDPKINRPIWSVDAIQSKRVWGLANRY